MYRTTGAGKDARPPAMMAMAMLVQGYLGMSDAEMIELTVLDLRVQMVLGCLRRLSASIDTCAGVGCCVNATDHR